MSESILERVTTEEAVVSLGSSRAGIVVARVPEGFFENTSPPVLGRPFLAEDYAGAPEVCILSYSLWERFGAGASDAPLELGELGLRVVGVMPDDFDIPDGAAVWIPASGGAP